MMRFWLMDLPSTDSAFAPIQRAAELCDPADYALLWQAHQRALLDGAWSRSMDVLEARETALRDVADRPCDDPRDEYEADAKRRDGVEALGYALGVTAVRVAIREHVEELAVA